MTSSVKETLKTILVVHNDEEVREGVLSILKNASFRVLSARGGSDAINLAEGTTGAIHMVLCGVDVPQMSGPDLGEALKMTRPDIRVMLMSGLENGNLLVLNYGWAYIHKPFIATKLVQMIKYVLHSANRSQLGGQEFDSSKGTRSGDSKRPVYVPRTTEKADNAPAPPRLDPEISRVIAGRRQKPKA